MVCRRLLLSAAIAATASATALAHPLPAPALTESLGSEDATVGQAILALREEIRQAAAARDTAKLRSFYAEAFVHTHGSGLVDGRDARLVALTTGDPVIETAPVTDLVIRVHGADLAVVTGRSPILNVREQRHYDFRWTQVFTRVSGRWQVAASHATRLGPVA